MEIAYGKLGVQPGSHWSEIFKSLLPHSSSLDKPGRLPALSNLVNLDAEIRYAIENNHNRDRDIPSLVKRVNDLETACENAKSGLERLFNDGEESTTAIQWVLKEALDNAKKECEAARIEISAAVNRAIPEKNWELSEAENATLKKINPDLPENASYRQILNLAENGPLEESAIKASYRKLSLKYHPDKRGGEIDTFQLIGKAHDFALRKYESSKAPE